MKFLPLRILRLFLTLVDAGAIDSVGGGAPAADNAVGDAPDTGSQPPGDTTAGGSQQGDATNVDQGAAGGEGQPPGDQPEDLSMDPATLSTELATHRTKLAELEPKLAEQEARLTSAIVIDDPSEEAAKAWDWKPEVAKLPEAHYSRLAYGLTEQHLPEFLPHVLEHGMSTYTPDQRQMVFGAIGTYLADVYGITPAEIIERLANTPSAGQPGAPGSPQGQSLVDELLAEGYEEKDPIVQRARATEGRLSRVESIANASKTQSEETAKQQRDAAQHTFDQNFNAVRDNVWKETMSTWDGKVAPEDKDMIGIIQTSAEKAASTDPVAQQRLLKAKQWAAVGNKTRSAQEMVGYRQRVSELTAPIAQRLLKLPATVSRLEDKVREKQLQNKEVIPPAGGPTGNDEATRAILAKYDMRDNDQRVQATQELEALRRGAARTT